MAESRSTHTTTEKLVKPVSKLMTNIMLGEKVKWAFGKNPLSQAYHLEKQLLSCAHAGGYFGFQLDESTDVQSAYQHLMYYYLSLRKITAAEQFLLLLLLLLFLFVISSGGGWLFFYSIIAKESCIGSFW